MFAVGHLALGYLVGKASSKLLSVDANVSFLFLFAMLPDIDLVMQHFGLAHRGPTHSLVLFCLVFLPIFVLFRREAFPYFVALAQHPIIGDLLTGGGSQLFWPLSLQWYQLGSMNVASITSITVEWGAFLGSMLLLFKFHDMRSFVRPHTSNLALTVPLVSVSFSLLAFMRFVPGFQCFTYGFRVPTALLIPHVTFFLLFTIAIVVDLALAAKALVKRIVGHRLSDPLG